MSTTPTSVHGEYGITNTLANYTIESESITQAPQREVVPDQLNAVANEILYDTRYNLRLTMRGATAPSAETNLSYDSKTWIVDEVEKAGSYNGLKRYNITAHRYTNYPAQNQ